ncbi:MAG: response regulator [Myxococcales bacterium]|nr:response regulator [Myxococcales bacterium]
MTNRAVSVLLVEDNPADVRLAREAMKASKLQLDITVVEDGELALDYLSRRGAYVDATRPDLILLDLNLPRLSGLTVLERIKSDPELRPIPVVVLTTSDSQDDIMRSYSLHANCYIRKPPRLEDFIRVVQSIDDFWFTIVRLPPRATPAGV